MAPTKVLRKHPCPVGLHVIFTVAHVATRRKDSESRAPHEKTASKGGPSHSAGNLGGSFKRDIEPCKAYIGLYWQYLGASSSYELLEPRKGEPSLPNKP